MNKKEVSEIKKQFHPNYCSISRIVGCYVDGEKNKKAVFKNAFLSLPEETVFKYLEIFKKNLSGSIGKNLFNMEFPLAEESEGGAQDFLYNLRNSKLNDSDMLDMFYDKVIENYAHTGNYLILLIYSDYDIPGKTSDNLDMYDASDEVYSYIMCMICPVDLSKPGLSYYEDSNDFHERTRDWVAGVPEVGFLYPAFNDRSTDIHSLLYHVKNPSELHLDFTDNVLGCVLQGSAKDQENAFVSIVEESLSDNCTFEAVKQVLSEIDELADAAEDSSEPMVIGKSQMSGILEAHMDDDAAFAESWKASQETAGDIMIDNVASGGKCSMKMDNVEVKALNGFSECIEMKIVDGKKCLVIPVEGRLFMNGIQIQD